MAKEHAGEEMRKYSRSEMTMPFSYQTSQGSESRTSFTKNISSGGLCFETDMPISRGDLLQIEVDEPAAVKLRRGAPAFVKAQVVWVNKQADDMVYESGLKFLN